MPIRITIEKINSVGAVVDRIITANTKKACYWVKAQTIDSSTLPPKNRETTNHPEGNYAKPCKFLTTIRYVAGKIKVNDVKQTAVENSFWRNGYEDWIEAFKAFTDKEEVQAIQEYWANGESVGRVGLQLRTRTTGTTFAPA